MGLLVDCPNERVHDQDGVGYALRQAAEVADEYSQQTAAYAEDDLTFRGNRAGDVVGRHEDSAEHQTAVKHLIQHPLEVALAAHREEEGDDCNGEDVRCRNVDGDDLAPQQVQTANDQCQCGGLADNAAGLAEQGLDDRAVRQSAGLEACERSCGGDRIGNGDVAEERQLRVRCGPGGHEAGPGSHHERTCAERRVHEVLADAAEQHLDNDDAEQTAEYGQPQRSCDRNVERDQNAGDEAGKVAYRVLMLYDFVVNGFKYSAGHHRNDNMDECANAEVVDRNSQCRNERDEHVEHQAPGVIIRLDMRRGGYDYFAKIISHFRFPPYLFSALAAASASAFFFSASAFARSAMRLAWILPLVRRNCATSGMRAGQT